MRPTPPPDPFPPIPAACLREHPLTLKQLEEIYLRQPQADPKDLDTAKARDELRAKSDDGERYGALLKDYQACRIWLLQQADSR